MRRIGFHRAATLEEALDLRARWRDRASVVAGGTDLLVGLRSQSRSLPPLEVIDLTPLAALRGVELRDDRAWIGPLTSHAAIEQDDRLRRRAPLLAEACAAIGSPQIRHRGTLGGNLVNAASCADTLPPLVALGATFTLRSAEGRREVPAAGFVTAPYRTVLSSDEILTAVSVPLLREDERGAFRKLGRRNALSVSRLSIAVVCRRDGRGSLRNVRIAAGSLVPVARRFPEAEACLEGSSGEEAAIAAAGEALSAAVVRETGRRWSTPYKEPVAAAFLRRTIRAALADDP